ncbi:hypothetical protein CTT30_23410 (plasmid) [Vibrio coralliilyticus]|nr:hypothetical protein CTT30_23410 [Vibrio coralliilyticus]
MNHENVQKHNPIDAQNKKHETRKRWIIFTVSILLVLAAFVFYYARSVVLGSQTLQTPSEVKSKVSRKPASQQASQKDIALSDNNPAKRVIANHEDNQKSIAKKAGGTHIDSTSALAEKAAAESKKVPTVTTKPKEKKEPKTGNSQKKTQKTQKTEPSPDQIRRANMAMLLNVSPYFPIDLLDKERGEVEKKISDLYTELEKVDDINEYTVSIASEAPNQLTAEQALDSSSSITRRLPTNTTTDSKPIQTDDIQKVKVAGSGEMILCELRWTVDSDYKLPLFCDVVEPPLQPAVIVGSFEFTQRKNGILLKGNRFEFGDESVAINAYGMDITTNTSPLFNNNYDSHFIERTLARASAAFMLPFVDYVIDSSTVIADGNTVITTPSISDTKDKVIGGLAGVAKEFLPDLRANANLPPTITIPDKYVVGMVMVSPLYLSSESLAEVAPAQPARATTTFNFEG